MEIEGHVQGHVKQQELEAVHQTNPFTVHHKPVLIYVLLSLNHRIGSSTLIFLYI